MPGVQRIQYLARGKKLARACDAFSAPGARAVRGFYGPKSRSQETEMDHSPYLDEALLPLVIALPRMLAKIESELPTARPEERRRLETRAVLVRSLLAPSVPRPVSIERST